MTFEEELEKSDNSLIKRIGEYLLERAKVDPSIANNIRKDKKSLNECLIYIKDEIYKKAKEEGHNDYACGDGEIILNLAVHYYDEDDIVVQPKANYKVKTITKSTAKQAVQQHIYESKKTKKPLKKDVVEGQESLF